MFYYEISYFNQDFKSENTGPLTRAHVKSSQMRNEKRGTFATLKAFPSCWNRYNISIFWKPNLSKFFKMCWLAVSFEVDSVKFM